MTRASAPGPDEAARAKQAIRERVWALLERERAARFPGAEGRIPNFAGAPAAAARLASLPAWRAARVVKSNPQGRTSVGQVASRPVRAMPAGADPPIGRYTRAPVEVHEADPHAAEVAERLIALIAASWPGAAAEHVGSSAVPGLPGKGIVDLLLPTNPADIARVTQALFELGFQRQVPEAFPPTRPMLWGVLHHGSTDYRVHVHLVPDSSPRGGRHARLPGRPAGRPGAPAQLRCAQAGDRSGWTGRPSDVHQAKHDWIAAALRLLGLPGGAASTKRSQPGQVPPTADD